MHLWRRNDQPESAAPLPLPRPIQRLYGAVIIVLMVVRRLFLLTTERAKSTSTGADL